MNRKDVLTIQVGNKNFTSSKTSFFKSDLIKTYMDRWKEGEVVPFFDSDHKPFYYLLELMKGTITPDEVPVEMIERILKQKNYFMVGDIQKFKPFYFEKTNTFTGLSAGRILKYDYNTCLPYDAGMVINKICVELSDDAWIDNLDCRSYGSTIKLYIADNDTNKYILFERSFKYDNKKEMAAFKEEIPLGIKIIDMCSLHWEMQHYQNIQRKLIFSIY